MSDYKPLTHHMSSYQQYLKSKYKVLELTSPDEMLDCASSEYVDLALIKNKQRQRIREVQDGDGDGVTLSEALDVEGEKKKVILIEGGPGMGKSTLAINICKRWAEGKLLQAYDAVILLPLREKEIQEAKNLGELLLIIDDEMRKEVSKEMIMSSGEKLCFICEGFDELPYHLRTSSLVASLIEKLPKCTVVYTSRPEACSGLRATRVIAIDGFTEESVDDYISKTFLNVVNGKEMASKLKSEVKYNNWIRRILYVPINVAIVCLIFYHFSVLPDTLTQLYTLLFLRLILRHIITRTANLSQVNQLSSLNDLPPDVSEQFSQVCFVAYNGMLNAQAIFSSQDLVNMKVAEDNINGLGLLLITPSFSVYGRGKSYSFLHLTLQEFSAAWYLSKLPPEQQLKFFNKFWSHGSFEMVWMFYSGITNLKNEEVLYMMLISTVKLIDSDFTRMKTVDVMLSVYEAHNNEVCKVVGDYLEGNINFGEVHHSKHQVLMHALGYFVMEYTGMLRLISLSDLSLSAEELLVLIESLKKRSQLLYDQVTSDHLILKIPVQNNIKFFNSLIELLKNYPITELYLIGSSYTNQKVDNIHLTKLLYSSNSLNVLSIDNILFSDIPIRFTRYSTSSLCNIRMSGCKLTPKIDKVGKMLSQCKSIVSVDLSFNALEDKGVKELVNWLQNTTIRHLNVSGNNITAVGIDHMRRLITFGPSALTSIVVSRNPLRDEGVCLLLQSVTDFMEYIEFVDVSMTSSSYQHVANVLYKVRSISFTVCDDSDIIGSSIASATMLENIELTDLRHSHHNMIDGINQNKNIKIVSLSYEWNVLEDHGWKDVETLVKGNKSITELKINLGAHIEQQHQITVLVDLIANSFIRSLNISVYCGNCCTLNLLHILERISPRSVLERLRLHFSTGAQGDKTVDYHQICQDVYGYTQQINSNRSTEGIVNPLVVSISISCDNEIYAYLQLTPT